MQLTNQALVVVMYRVEIKKSPLIIREDFYEEVFEKSVEL